MEKKTESFDVLIWKIIKVVNKLGKESSIEELQQTENEKMSEISSIGDFDLDRDLIWLADKKAADKKVDKKAVKKAD